MSGLVIGFSLGLVFSFPAGGSFCIQHFMVRLILWWHDVVPLGYVSFLDYATELIFLRKVGGGYIFVHRMLMEHLAAQYGPTCLDDSSAPQNEPELSHK